MGNLKESHRSELVRILHNHMQRYPALEIQDVYKLLHQAALGSEHAVNDPAAARRWMEREIQEVQAADGGQGSSEPAWEAVSPDNRLLRVHLRPFLAQGGDPEVLLQAFIRTANGYRGSIEALRQFWNVAEHLAGTDRSSWNLDEMRRFIVRMGNLGFPAVHHSAVYEAAYMPAYRVVARPFLEELGWQGRTT